MRFKAFYIGMMLTLAVSSGPALARPSERVLGCELTDGTGWYGGERRFQVRVDASAEIVTLSWPNGGAEAYKNGPSRSKDWKGYVSISGVKVTYGRIWRRHPASKTVSTLDLSTGELIEVANGRQVHRAKCSPVGAETGPVSSDAKRPL